MLRFYLAQDGAADAALAISVAGAHRGRAAYVHPFPECVFRGGVFEALRFSLSARRIKSSRKERRRDSERGSGKGGSVEVVDELRRIVADALTRSAPPPGGLCARRTVAARTLLQRIESEIARHGVPSSGGVSSGSGSTAWIGPKGRIGPKGGKIRF